MDLLLQSATLANPVRLANPFSVVRSVPSEFRTPISVLPYVPLWVCETQIDGLSKSEDEIKRAKSGVLGKRPNTY